MCPRHRSTLVLHYKLDRFGWLAVGLSVNWLQTSQQSPAQAASRKQQDSRNRKQEWTSPGKPPISYHQQVVPLKLTQRTNKQTTLHPLFRTTKKSVSVALGKSNFPGLKSFLFFFFVEWKNHRAMPPTSLRVVCCRG